MLVLVLPPVSSRVSGFPVASPCLWGKLQNLSFCHVANCENWRKPRTKCWFFCMHVSCLESLVFLWLRRVYGGSWKTFPFRRFPRRLSCCFAWQAWLAAFPVASPCLWGKLENMSFSNVSKQVVMSFCVAGVALCDIPTCLITCRKCQNWRKSRTKCSFLLHPRVSFRVSGFPVASPCLWGKLENMSFSNVSKQVVMSFCVAGVALCDIPTCLITCRKCQNWRKSRTKCSFLCTHVSRLESLVFLWRRRVYGGSSFTLHTPQFTL